MIPITVWIGGKNIKNIPCTYYWEVLEQILRTLAEVGVLYVLLFY